MYKDIRYVVCDHCGEKEEAEGYNFGDGVCYAPPVGWYQFHVGRETLVMLCPACKAEFAQLQKFTKKEDEDHG